MAGVAIQVLIFAVMGWLMTREMRRHPAAGFFRPVLFAFMPILMISVASFTAIHDMKAEELSSTKAALVGKFTQLLQGSSGAAQFSENELASLAEASLRLQPAALCVFWLGLLTLTALFLRKWLASKGQVRAAAPLSRWQAPYFMIWVLLVPAAVLALDARHWLGDVEVWISDLSQNLVIVFLAIYLFQGMMVVLERASRLGLPKPVATAVLVSALFLALLPAGHGIGLGLLALGILDTWIDFRKLAPPKTGDDERSRS